MKTIPERVKASFWDYVQVGSPDECWPWLRSCNVVTGYGQVSWAENGKSAATGAHRVAYETAKGAIPDNLTVHHTCHNRPCCNPAHLVLLTREENSAITSKQWDTHCPKGHPFSEHKGIRGDGYRYCKACNRERVARYYATHGRPSRAKVPA